MASPASAKSQSLHNFSLPQLRWKKNSTNNLPHGRHLTDSPPHQSPPPRRQSPSPHASQKQSPMRESASESKSGFVSDPGQISASAPEGIKRRGSVPDCDNVIEKLDIETKSKIYIRVPKSIAAEFVEEENNQGSLQEKDENSNQEKRVTVENHEVEDCVERQTWNLRPRKPLRKPSSANNGGTVKMQENKSLIRPQSNAYTTNTEENKDKKKKFSISLTREEIEEDIFILTGSMPSRKPKKRAKNVQKQLDNLFPGKWLSSITPDCYEVPDPPKKG